MKKEKIQIENTQQKSKNKTKENLLALCESAIMAALAVVLSFVDIQIGTFGGSINLVMVPLVLLSVRRGLLWGMGTGAVAGLAKCIFAGGLQWGLPSVLLDYVLAYAVVGLAGVFKKTKFPYVLGGVLGGLARYFIHFLSGILLYAIAVGDSASAMGITFTSESSWIYSLVYNGLFMVPSIIITCIIVWIYQAYEKHRTTGKNQA